jgi:hypothetical protein
MKICIPHWNQLREAVDDAGLGHLVKGADNAKVLIEKGIDQFKFGVREPESPSTFDPLWNCNFAIWNNAIDMGGLYLMGSDDSGNPYCPICEAIANCPKDLPQSTADWWIDSAVKEQYQKAMDLGLIKVQ